MAIVISTESVTHIHFAGAWREVAEMWVDALYIKDIELTPLGTGFVIVGHDGVRTAGRLTDITGIRHTRADESTHPGPVAP